MDSNAEVRTGQSDGRNDGELRGSSFSRYVSVVRAQEIDELVDFGESPISVITSALSSSETLYPKMEDYVFGLITDGRAKMQLTYDGCRQFQPPAWPGRLIVFPAHTETLLELEGKVQTVSIAIPADLARSWLSGAGVRDFSGFGRLTLGTAIDPFTRAAMERMVACTRQRSPSNDLLVEHLGLTLVMHLAQRANPGLRRRGETRRLTFAERRRLTDFARSQIGRRIKLEHLAAVLGMSSFHFARAFKESTGITPHQWLLEIRVERAVELLRSPQRMTLDAIASECGLANRSHLESTLQRIRGVSSRDLRHPAANRQITDQNEI